MNNGSGVAVDSGKSSPTNNPAMDPSRNHLGSPIERSGQRTEVEHVVNAGVRFTSGDSDNAHEPTILPFRMPDASSHRPILTSADKLSLLVGRHPGLMCSYVYILTSFFS